MSKIDGVAVGTVKVVSRDGEVQVAYRGVPGLNHSRLAPVATMLAGKGNGSWMMPEVGDEALIAFRNGNAEEPYIIGFLWNGEDQPPEHDAPKRLIRSKSGHSILLDDTSGSEKVVVRSKSGLTVTLDDAQSMIQLEGGGRRMVLQSGKVEFS